MNAETKKVRDGLTDLQVAMAAYRETKDGVADKATIEFFIKQLSQIKEFIDSQEIG